MSARVNRSNGPWKRSNDVSDRPSVISQATLRTGKIVNGGYAICTCWGPDAARNANAISALPAAEEALRAILAAFDEPHYGDHEQRSDAIYDAIENTGARLVLARLQGELE